MEQNKERKPFHELQPELITDVVLERERSPSAHTYLRPFD
jgi:hypothetical protein